MMSGKEASSCRGWCLMYVKKFKNISIRLLIAMILTRCLHSKRRGFSNLFRIIQTQTSTAYCRILSNLVRLPRLGEISFQLTSLYEEVSLSKDESTIHVSSLFSSPRTIISINQDINQSLNQIKSHHQINQIN